MELSITVLILSHPHLTCFLKMWCNVHIDPCYEKIDLFRFKILASQKICRCNIGVCPGGMLLSMTPNAHRAMISNTGSIFFCLMSGLARSMPNADQCRSKSWHWSEMPLNRHWSELIDIGINARILIGIDRHWSALGIDQGSPVDVYDVRIRAIMHVMSHILVCFV